jgi:hypothetical protein
MVPCDFNSRSVFLKNDEEDRFTNHLLKRIVFTDRMSFRDCCDGSDPIITFRHGDRYLRTHKIRYSPFIHASYITALFLTRLIGAPLLGYDALPFYQCVAEIAGAM